MPGFGRFGFFAGFGVTFGFGSISGLLGFNSCLRESGLEFFQGAVQRRSAGRLPQIFHRFQIRHPPYGRLRFRRVDRRGRLISIATQVHFLPPAIRRVQHHPFAFTVDGQSHVAYLGYHVERLAGLAMPGQVQCVFRNLLFELAFDLIRGAEEAIRGHRVLDSLVGPVKVVRVDEMPDAPPRILDV